MMKSGFIALAALLITTGAAAADEATEAPKQEKKICRSEPMTGSRTRITKICKTEAEWRELSANTKRGIDEMGNRVASGVTQGN